ncbi:MAG: hypothetical protein ACLUP5_00470 [Streptococcus sp.]
MEHRIKRFQWIIFSSVDDSFRLDFKSFAWGIIFALVGFNMMGSSILGGLILAAYGILTVLSAFQTLLILNLTSGGAHVLSVVVFEKSKTFVFAKKQLKV